MNVFGGLALINRDGEAVTLRAATPTDIDASLDFVGAVVLDTNENGGGIFALCRRTFPPTDAITHDVDGFVLASGRSIDLVFGVRAAKKKEGSIRQVELVYEDARGVVSRQLFRFVASVVAPESTPMPCHDRPPRRDDGESP